MIDNSCAQSILAAMPTTSVKYLNKVLNSLAERARMRDHKPDLSPAIALVNDLGRLIVRGKATDIRAAQASVAAVREQLEFDDAANTPYKALTGLNSHAYLAGALWAINELMTIRLDTMPPTPPKGRLTRRSQIRDLVLSAVASADTITPSSLLQSTSDQDITPRLDEISRTLGELLVEGLVAVAEPEPGTDRRTKHYVSTVEGRAVADGRFQTEKRTTI